MFKNKLGEDSPIPEFIHLKIRRRDGVESLTTLEEGEFKAPIDGCIKVTFTGIVTLYKNVCHIIQLKLVKLFLTRVFIVYKVNC